MTELSDEVTDVGVHIQAVKTLFTNIHVSLAKWNVATTLRGVLMIFYLLIPVQAGWSLEKAAPRFTFSKKESYDSRRISVILLHMFAQCLIALSFSTSLGSRKAYHICIELMAMIILHPHKTLRRPLPDLRLSLVVHSVPDMNNEFSLDTDPATSSRATRTRIWSNGWDMTAAHAFSCLCDELKPSVDKSGCLDDA